MRKPGELAPDFTAIDCHGRRVVLSDIWATKKVVLFFFPRVFSPACTLEVQNFRDNFSRITSLDTELIGVSVDKGERSCKFAQEEGLQFALIGDESRAISESYGVVWPLLRIDRRATFVIAKGGRIEDVIHHEVQVYRHLEDVLERLGSPAPPSSDPTVR